MQIGAHDLRLIEPSNLGQSKKVVYEISIEIIERYLDDWIIEAECEMQSVSKIYIKRNAIEKFFWWMRRSGRVAISEKDDRGFQAYIINAHHRSKPFFGN